MAAAVTILLADDDRVQTLMLSTCLKAKGFKVVVAHDGMEAFAVALRTSPDVIILDIQMPAGTGIVVLERLKASSKTVQIPVIVLSANINPETVRTLKELGADEFLCKPVDLDMLYGAVSRALAPPDAPLQSGA